MMKIYCKNCGAEKLVEFTIENFKKHLYDESNYMCVNCIVKLLLN